MTDRIRAHLYISGRVQGVFYRATTREEAQKRGVDGWVRNLDDGRVEAVFEGPESSVNELVDWCDTGSKRAEVSEVRAEYVEPEGLSGFEIRR